MERSAGWITQAVTGTLYGPDRMVTGPVVTDLREAQEGSRYVARHDEMSDEHGYAQTTVERGAVGVIVERILDLDPRIAQILIPESTRAPGDFASAHLHDLRINQNLDMIATTGSVGKTATKDLLFQILSTDAPTIVPKLSFNDEVEPSPTVLSADHTTRHTVLEMGASGPGHITYLAEVAAPDAAVELMIGHAHLGGFDSVEGVTKAKAELIVGSVPDAPVILNADNERVMAMAPLTDGPIWTFSASGKPEMQVRTLNVTRDAFDHARFTFLTPEGRGEATLGVTDAHHVNNALAVISSALVLGIRFDTVLAAADGATALSPHRMDVVDLEVEGVPFTLIDDAYNANLDSMRAGFAAPAVIGQNHLRFAVLSEMLELGEGSAELRQAVGGMARDGGVKTLVVLGGDSHFYLEGVGEKVEGMLVGGVEEAAALLCAKLEPGCVVLAKEPYGSQSWKVADLLREKGVQC